MQDIADLYDQTRTEIRAFVSQLEPEALATIVPATPEWTVKDVVAHLVGDVDATLHGGFPIAFFANFGTPDAVAELNAWTASEVAKRSDRTIDQLFAEWDELAPELLAMVRGEVPLPDGAPAFAGIVLLTDIAVHLHDLYGAFGIVRGRDDPPVKIAVSGYIAAIGWRTPPGGPVLALETDGKRWTIAPGDPAATVTAPSRFELFRALSGRRSPDQIRAYDWTGDPEPFIELFYPYGVRAAALVD